MADGRSPEVNLGTFHKEKKFQNSWHLLPGDKVRLFPYGGIKPTSFDLPSGVEIIVSPNKKNPMIKLKKEPRVNYLGFGIVEKIFQNEKSIKNIELTAQDETNKINFKAKLEIKKPVNVFLPLEHKKQGEQPSLSDEVFKKVS